MFNSNKLYQLQYRAHLYLTLKNKHLITISLYFIFLLLISLIYNGGYIYCMTGENESDRLSEIPTPEETQAEYVQFLENEIMQIDAKRSSLEHYSKQLERKLDFTETDVEQIKEDKDALIEEVQSLEGQLAEAKETTKDLVRDNIGLRREIIERHQSYIEQIQELETQKKICEDKLKNLRK